MSANPYERGNEAPRRLTRVDPPWQKDTELIERVTAVFGAIPELSGNNGLSLLNFRERPGDEYVVFANRFHETVEYKVADAETKSLARRERLVVGKKNIKAGTYVDVPLEFGRVRYGIVDSDPALFNINFFSQPQIRSHRTEKSVLSIAHRQGTEPVIRFQPRSTFPITQEDENKLFPGMGGLEVVHFSKGVVATYADSPQGHVFSVERRPPALEVQFADPENKSRWHISVPDAINFSEAIDAMEGHSWQDIGNTIPVACFGLSIP